VFRRGSSGRGSRIKGRFSLLKRVEERIRAWDILVEETQETETAFLAFGARHGQAVALKVFRRPGDEWDSGAVLEAFGSRGAVGVYERVEGAVLLERLRPGTALTHLSLNGKDEEATAIIAGVIRRMSNPPKTLAGAATVEDWGKGFERYRASGERQIPPELVRQAQALYSALCSSQKDARLSIPKASRVISVASSRFTLSLSHTFEVSIENIGRLLPRSTILRPNERATFGMLEAGDAGRSSTFCSRLRRPAAGGR
jgi:hypothetical protein